MKRIFLTVAVLAATIFSIPARAQRAGFELDCPAGYVPQVGPTSVTQNSVTGKYRQQTCIDVNGNLVNLGAITEIASGAFVTGQTTEFLQSLVNGCSPFAEFQAINGALAYTTDALTGCISVPFGATVGQINAVAGYVKQGATSTVNQANPVGGYFQCESVVNGGNCWGINTLLTDKAGLTALTLQNEFDFNVLSASTTVVGLSLAARFTAAPSNTTAIAVGRTTGFTNPWNGGFLLNDGCCQIGMSIGTATSGNNVSSQTLTFTGRDSGGVNHVSVIQGDASGNLSLQPISGQNVNVAQGRGLSFIEGAAPIYAVGQDVCYGDSAAHVLKCSNNGGTLLPVTQTIASGTAIMTTAVITAGTCGATVTVAASGVLATDSIAWSFSAAPAGSNAGLVAWPTAGNVNFAYCGIAETPAAATINWKVTR